MYLIKKEDYLKAQYIGVSIRDGKTKTIMLPNKLIPDYKGGPCFIFEHKHFEIIEDIESIDDVIEKAIANKKEYLRKEIERITNELESLDELCN